jgi:Na+/H+ antiporter NhaD/arsenite permease-like protein
MTGNPQNMIIGTFSHISYDRFVSALSPIAAAGSVLTIVLIALMYSKEFLTAEPLRAAELRRARYHGPSVIKSVLITIGMIGLFFAGQPVAKVAIIGGALLLFTRSIKAEKIYREIDWPLLMMFVGLFIVVSGLEKAVVNADAINKMSQLRLDQIPVLAAVTAVLSNLVSNVPAVLVLKPFVSSLRDPDRAWLVVAMASTLAGNLTLVGSVANLIVAQRARRFGVNIGFWDYFKVGAPLTLVSILVGIWVLK